MNVLGIIAEYNPFHCGHAYQIQTLKKETGADYVIIAMSGNFVQRGAPALMEKYSRARMALSCGADLVLELPVLYACASAEYFANGGIALLESTGVVTHLGFGTETEHFPLLQEIADLLCREPEPFRNALKQALRQGLPFPAARIQALEACLAAENSVGGPSFPEKDISLNHSFSEKSGCLPCVRPKQILASPNNILAVEYLKALSRCHSGIIPCPLLRRGQAYHDTAPGQKFSSASAIRTGIFKIGAAGRPYDKGNTDSRSIEKMLKTDAAARNILAELEISMPKAAFEILLNYPRPFLQENDFSPLFHYKLLTESAEQLSRYGDSSPDLARRMKKESHTFLSWNSFCLHLKSKNLTYARLSRVILHTLLNISQEDYQTILTPAYLRILGFRRQAAPLLSAIKAKGSLPLVTAPAAFQREQNKNIPSESLPFSGPIPAEPDAQRLLSLDLAAADLYRIGLASRGDASLKNDFRQPLVLL